MVILCDFHVSWCCKKLGSKKCASNFIACGFRLKMIEMVLCIAFLWHGSEI